MYLTVKKIQNSNQKIVEIKSMPLQTHMTVHSRTSITNNLAIYGQQQHLLLDFFLIGHRFNIMYKNCNKFAILA